MTQQDKPTLPFDSEAVDVPDDLNDLFADIENGIEVGEGSWLTKVREQPTSQRRAFAIAINLALFWVLAIALLRPDLSDMRLVSAVLLVTSPVAILATWQSLRPTYLPPLTPFIAGILRALSLVLAVAISMWPLTGLVAQHHPTISNHLVCFGWGLGLAMPFYFMTQLFDRQSNVGNPMNAVSAALLGSVILRLHCQHESLVHNLVHIAGYLAVFGTLHLLFTFKRNRLRSSQSKEKISSSPKP